MTTRARQFLVLAMSMSLGGAVLAPASISAAQPHTSSVSAAGAVVGSARARAVATATTLSVSPTVATFGGVQTVQGRVTKLGTSTGLAKKTVVVQRRSTTSAKWITVKTLRTDAKGAFSLRVTAAATMTYRATTPAQPSSTASTSRSVLAQVAPLVVASFSPKGERLTVGESVTYSGTVRPYRPTFTAVLQQKRGSTWTSRATSRVTSQGQFTVTQRATTGGTTTYRLLLSPGTAEFAAVAKSMTTLKQYRWISLAEQGTVQKSNNWDTSEPEVLGGVNYTASAVALYSWGSFGGWTSGWGEYNLIGECDSFAATIGIPDSSGSKASWTFSALTDGVETQLGTVGLNQAKAVNIDVSGGFRLRLQTTRTTGTPYADYRADGVWGNARILCNR